MQYVVYAQVTSFLKAKSLLNELTARFDLNILEHEEGGFRLKGEFFRGSCRPISSDEPQSGYSFQLKAESVEITRELEKLLGLPANSSPLVLSLIELAEQINQGNSPQTIAKMARWDSSRLEKYIEELKKAARHKKANPVMISAVEILEEFPKTKN